MNASSSPRAPFRFSTGGECRRTPSARQRCGAALGATLVRVPAPVDIVVVSHNRLDYLRRTVEALFERTPEPFRLTVVDNASDPDVRNWLAQNRHRFERVITLATNEHVAAFQHGIDATTSDPYVVSDPDIEVPALEPSWLARLRGLMERRPDYGLIGLALYGQAVPEDADPELVEGGVGTWFQMIRRDALREPYVKDSRACAAVREAGYRVGWTPSAVAYHLGHGDAQRYPGHIAAKNEVVSEATRRGELSPYLYYHRELEAIADPPALTQLARAAPIVAAIRAAGVHPAAVLELAWGEPAVGPALPDAAVLVEPPARLPLSEGSAGAVALLEPPDTALLDEAFRVAARLVVLVCDLAAVGGRTAPELARPGWDAIEQQSTADVLVELARLADDLPALAGRERFTTLEHRDEWLRLFAAGSFGRASTRLFVFRRHHPLRVPDRLARDETLPWWRPEQRVATPPPRSLAQRVAGRLRRH